MSPREKFDRFMADVRNGTNFKIASLSHAHYRAFFSAVLPIAAVSDVRGAFMVNDQPATVDHMRIMAPTLTVTECKSALDVFREAGLLEHDDDLGGEWVHDFEEWNPEPKHDRTNADRQQRYRERQKASRNATRNGARNAASNVTRNGPVTASNAGEVEVEELPPSPFTVDCEEWLGHYEQTTGHPLPGRATKAFHAVTAGYSARRTEGYTADDLKLATVGAHADRYRRENGYDVAESILRPTKIAALIAQGKLRSGRRDVTSAELGARLRGGAA